MRFIPQIPDFTDTRFLGRGANDAWNALLETLDVWRKAMQQPVHISGGPGIAVRDDQGFTISLMDPGEEAEEVKPGAIIVRVEHTGGEPFNTETRAEATYLYTVRALDDTTPIAENVKQERKRMKTNLIPGDTYGIGFYEGEEFKLWDAGETPVVSPCIQPTSEPA